MKKVLQPSDIDQLEEQYERKLHPVTSPFTDNPVLEETRKFVVEFSTRPCQKSGQKLEALCPAIQPAMNRNSILLTMAKASTDSFEGMHAELAECGQIFKQIEAIVGKENPVSILIIYPEGDGQRMLEATNPNRFEIKSDLMRDGIMAGAFFKDSKFSSTFDPNLKPLRSPYPTFVLRNTRRFDWVFVGGVPQWREIYINQFGTPPKPLQPVHCPVTRLKNTVTRILSGNRKKRQFSDGGRSKFWDMTPKKRYGKNYRVTQERN